MEYLKDLLTFNRSERRGIWLLLLLTGLFFAGSRIRGWQPRDAATGMRVAYLLADTSFHPPKYQYQNKKFATSEKNTRRSDSLFYFDPNTITAQQWEALGLSARQAEVITGYVARGGQFRTPDDLQRSFVISPPFFQKVKPYIRISSEALADKSSTKHASTQKQSYTSRICLNQADTAQLRSLRGIGPAYAARIVKYRDALGGFHDIAQLGEVYGLDEQIVAANKDRLVITNPQIQKIRVNEATEKELSRHPYISKRLAYCIVAARKQGRMIDSDDLRRRLPEGVELNPHLLPYLQF
jgi:competence ComEA-like helix-hairpin-helix protein